MVLYYQRYVQIPISVQRCVWMAAEFSRNMIINNNNTNNSNIVEINKSHIEIKQW